MTERDTFSERETEILRDSFQDLPDEFFDQFLKLAVRAVGDSHSVVHKGRSRNKLQFHILLEGAAAIWDDSYGEDTIDALITRGQLIGEFEFLGYDTQSYEIISLTDTVFARLNSAALALLVSKSSFEAMFYRSLSKTLVDKLQAQNTLLKFRTGDYDQRLAKLFDNFTRTEWLYLTDINEGRRKREYTINVFFNKLVLRGIIEGEQRSWTKGIQKLIDKKLLELFLYDQKLQPMGEITQNSDFEAFKKCRYFVVRILDRDQLAEISIAQRDNTSR